jgi:hypothetical protein
MAKSRRDLVVTTNRAIPRGGDRAGVEVEVARRILG